MKQHPLSAAYPAMPEADLLALAEDVKAHGLHEPVTMFEGMVLDGWHRCQACQIAGVEIRTIEFDGEDPRAFVVSKNAHRRHLSQSQKAAAAAIVYQWRPRGNPAFSNSAPGAELGVGDVAKVAGVSERTLRQAAVAVEAGLGEAVRNGEMSAKAAAAKANGHHETPKPSKEQRLLDQLDQLKHETAELREKLRDVTDELESYLNASAEEQERQKEFQKLRAYIRTVESQRDDYMAQVAQWKRECKALRKRLGE